MSDDLSLSELQEQFDAQLDSAMDLAHDPRSVINMVPPAFAVAIEAVPREFFLLDEDQLRTRCFGDEPPDATTNRLRLGFWLEYERAMTTGVKQLDLLNVYNGVCSRQFFFNVAIRDKNKLAWILTPPSDYETAIKDLLMLSLVEMRKIMTMPVGKVKGMYDTRHAELKFKIYLAVEARDKGAIVQRVDERRIVAYMGTKKDKSKVLQNPEEKPALPDKIEDIDRRIAERLAQEQSALPLQTSDPEPALAVHPDELK